jgi:hypothetical protein
MVRFYLLGLLFLSMPAFASNWQMTYYNAGSGSLLVDKDSIVEMQGSMRKFWTLYAPRVTVGQPGVGYAYRKMLHLFSCMDRTAAVTQSIYYDVNQTPHDANVDDKSMHDILPDSENDYLWQFVCKPDQQANLVVPVGKGISRFLEDQVKFTNENDRLLKKANSQ